MNLFQLEKYAENEIRKGRGHQELFNELASTTSYRIHDLAEILRKLVTPAKKDANKTTNYVLLGCTGILVLMNLWGYLNTPTQSPLTNLIPAIVQIAMLFGLYKFWKNIYRIALFFLWANLMWLVVQTVLNFDWFFILLIFFIIDSMIICFYLNVKTCTDYKLNKELLAKNPGARENSILFDA